jgi:TolB-like protein
MIRTLSTRQSLIPSRAAVTKRSARDSLRQSKKRGYRFVAQISTDARPLESQPSARSPRTRLLVLPFRMLRPDAEPAFLASSLPDAIAASLAGLESQRVRPTLTAARVESEPPDLRAIAEALEVNIVLMGSILNRDGRLRTTTQLREAPGGGARLDKHLRRARDNLDGSFANHRLVQSAGTGAVHAHRIPGKYPQRALRQVREGSVSPST